MKEFGQEVQKYEILPMKIQKERDLRFNSYLEEWSIEKGKDKTQKKSKNVDISFRYIAKWFSYTYIYIYIYIIFQILFHYRLLQDTEYSCLCYTVGPCWLSILYIVVCISVNPKLLIYPSPASPKSVHCVSFTLFCS